MRSYGLPAAAAGYLGAPPTGSEYSLGNSVIVLILALVLVGAGIIFITNFRNINDRHRAQVLDFQQRLPTFIRENICNDSYPSYRVFGILLVIFGLAITGFAVYDFMQPA